MTSIWDPDGIVLFCRKGTNAAQCQKNALMDKYHICYFWVFAGRNERVHHRVVSGQRNSGKESLMKTDSLLGVWTGTAHSINGWDMKITLSILQPFEIGSTLGIFNIPML